jgi:hypothetical protein
MEGCCSKGQRPQRAVMPMEEEEEFLFKAQIVLLISLGFSAITFLAYRDVQYK